MSITIYRIYDHTGNETGAIIYSRIDHATNAQEKAQIEKHLEDFAFQQLYPEEGLNIFGERNSDTPAIIVIRNINNLEYDFLET